MIIKCHCGAKDCKTQISISMSGDPLKQVWEVWLTSKTGEESLMYVDVDQLRELRRELGCNE